MKSNEVLPKWDHPHQYFWPTPGEDSTNQTKHDNLPYLFKNGESGENSMCRSPFVTKLLQWTVESLNIKDSQPLRTKNTDFSPSSYWNSENFQFTSLENHFSRIRIYVEISSGYTLLLILGMLENVSSKTINSLKNLRLQNGCTNTHLQNQAPQKMKVFQTRNDSDKTKKVTLTCAHVHPF